MNFSRRGSPRPQTLSIKVPDGDKMMNPLSAAHLRNLKCPCGSLKKVKKFCGSHAVIHKEYYNIIKPWIESNTH